MFLQTHQRAATPVSTVEFIEGSSTQALIRRAWMNSVNRIVPTSSRIDYPVAVMMQSSGSDEGEAKLMNDSKCHSVVSLEDGLV